MKAMKVCDGGRPHSRMLDFSSTALDGLRTVHDIDLNLNSVYRNSSALRRPGLTNDDSARQLLFGDCGSNVLGEMSNLDEVHIVCMCAFNEASDFKM